MTIREAVTRAVRKVSKAKPSAEAALPITITEAAAAETCPKCGGLANVPENLGYPRHLIRAARCPGCGRIVERVSGYV